MKNSFIKKSKDIFFLDLKGEVIKRTLLSHIFFWKVTYIIHIKIEKIFLLQKWEGTLITFSDKPYFLFSALVLREIGTFFRV